MNNSTPNNNLNQPSNYSTITSNIGTTSTGISLNTSTLPNTTYLQTAYDGYIFKGSFLLDGMIARSALLVHILEREKPLIQDLDCDNLQKMLNGTKEDIAIAIELLKGKTSYLWRILHEIKINGGMPDSSAIDYILQDFIIKNIYNLNLGDNLV